MGFLENLTNDAFANKMADHYHTHIGAAEFKNISMEAKRADSPRTPAWGAQPFLDRGMQGGINALTAPALDSVRVAGFMASPKGLLFIAKQTGLQRSNPLGEFGVNPIHSNRRYNPAATLAQALLSPLGIHIDRHDKGSQNSEDLNYEKRIKKLNVDSPTSNRLLNIAHQLHSGYHRGVNLTPSEINIFKTTDGLVQRKDSRKKNSFPGRPEGPFAINVMSGLGGPNSLFGIGSTTHRAFLTNQPGNINIYYKPPPRTVEVGNPGPHSYGALKKEGDYKELGESKDYLFDPTANDYKPPRNSIEPGNPGRDSYSKKHPEGEIENNKNYFFDPTANYYKPPRNSTEPGNPGDDSYTKLNPEGLYDTVDGDNEFNPITIPSENEPNALLKYKTLDYGGITRQAKDKSSGIFKSFSKGTKYSSEELGQAAHGIIDYGNSKGVSDTYGLENDESDDYIPFIIGKGDEELKLRSYGLGSITDNTSFSWSEVKYAGRTMAMHKFDSVSRDVSHDLTIVAFTKAELLTNIEKVNKLYQMASPSINGSGYPSGAFLEFTLGDLYRKQNVIMDKITFTVDDSTSWDLDLGHQLPMLIKLSLSYKLLTNSDGDFFTADSKYFGGSGGVDGLLARLGGFGS